MVEDVVGLEDVDEVVGYEEEYVGEYVVGLEDVVEVLLYVVEVGDFVLEEEFVA